MSASRSRLSVIASVTLASLLLPGCDPDPLPGPTTTDSSSAPTVSTRTPTTSPSSPPAEVYSAGSRQPQRQGPRPNLSAAGANAAPAAPDIIRWTPKATAEFLVTNGLLYDTGVRNTVLYASCSGVQSSYSSVTDGFSEFDCYVETKETDPYWIELNVPGDATVRFKFRHYAD